MPNPHPPYRDVPVQVRDFTNIGDLAWDGTVDIVIEDVTLEANEAILVGRVVSRDPTDMTKCILASTAVNTNLVEGVALNAAAAAGDNVQILKKGIAGTNGVFQESANAAGALIFPGATGGTADDAVPATGEAPIGVNLTLVGGSDALSPAWINVP